MTTVQTGPTSRVAALLVPRLLLSEISAEGVEALASPFVRRILVIDDDRSFCKQIADLGASRGLHVHTTASFDELEATACVDSYDMALVACSLVSEGPEGLEWARGVKVLAPHFPLVLVSCESRTRLPRKLLHSSFCVSVSKREGLGHILASALRLAADAAA